MPKDDVMRMIGTVQEVLPAAMFRVKLEDSPQVVLAYLSGKIRQNSIEILQGDRVELEISVYDLNKGRIVYRHK